MSVNISGYHPQEQSGRLMDNRIAINTTEYYYSKPEIKIFVNLNLVYTENLHKLMLDSRLAISHDKVVETLRHL